MIAVGVARPIAQGQAIIKTATIFITAFKNTPVYTGDELNADMSSSFGGIPRSLERGGCHKGIGRQTEVKPDNEKGLQN